MKRSPRRHVIVCSQSFSAKKLRFDYFLANKTAELQRIPNLHAT